MSDVSGVEAAVERSHDATAAIITGDAAPFLNLFSHEDDVTLANPWGPPVRGFDEVRAAVERAAGNYRDGEVAGYDRLSANVAPELAYTLEIERFQVKLPGHDDMTPVALRVTSVYRPEDGEWRLVHRHADPITTPRAPETLSSD